MPVICPCAPPLLAVHGLLHCQTFTSSVFVIINKDRNLLTLSRNTPSPYLSSVEPGCPNRESRQGADWLLLLLLLHTVPPPQLRTSPWRRDINSSNSCEGPKTVAHQSLPPSQSASSGQKEAELTMESLRLDKPSITNVIAPFWCQIHSMNHLFSKH